MNAGRKKIVIGVVAVVVLGAVAAGALAFAGGNTGALGGDADEGSAGSDGGASDGGSGDGGAATATPAMEDTNASFQFTIDEIEECGNTCRDVTATIVNDGGEAATGIVVETTMSADGDVVWEGTEEVGELPANESYTSTREVDVGYDGGMKIQQNDGYVTIETVIDFGDGTEVFSERRQVA